MRTRRFRYGIRMSSAAAALAVGLVAFLASACLGAHDVLLYEENLEDGVAQGWDLGAGWSVLQEPGGNWALHGQDGYWAVYQGEGWQDYTVTLRAKLISGILHINWRYGPCGRYYIVFQEGTLFLKKVKPWGVNNEVASIPSQHNLNQWYNIRIVSVGGQIDIFINDQHRLSYSDGDPCLSGSIAFETLGGSEAYVDDISILSEGDPFEGEWQRCGGPPGGLGYDIRYRFDSPTTWFVTDAYGGAHRSTNDGADWDPVNSGITARGGRSGDAIPVFSIAVDPHNSNVIWAGTQNELGIYKSVDGGANWTKKVGGITLNPLNVSVRGITIHPSDSNTVFAQAEIASGNWAGQQLTGKGFDLTMGVVWKTTNGGDTWTEIWRGDNLARYLLINPDVPATMYVSTGIFDREAANSDPDTDDPGGVGILKSTDGGATWTELNASNGLGNLYVGSLFMHPVNPDILLAGTGNYSYNDDCGVYLSADAGATWTHVLPTSGAVGSVEFALSNPLIAYAGTPQEIFRSEDGALTWTRIAGGPPMHNWGPPGMWAGIPIDFQVDPSDPDRIFVNNYGGGNVLSEDGGTTWTDASEGYTGSLMRHVDVHPSDPRLLHVNGKSGPFQSGDGGDTWIGLSYAPAVSGEWGDIAADPSDPQTLLVADMHQGFIYRSADGGSSWVLVYDAADSYIDDDNRGSFWDIRFAPSDPDVVYTGILYWWKDDGELAVIRSTDNGQTWQTTNDALLAGARVRALCIDPSDADVVYAATELQQVFKTADGGATWTSASTGLPSLRAASMAMDPSDPLTLYVGFFDGGVYKTSNGGATWSQSSYGMDPEARITGIVVDPTDPHVVYAGDENSGVYRSTSAGYQWTLINDGLRTRAVNTLAISAGGEMLYAVTEGEGVFRFDVKDEIPSTLAPATDTNPVGTSHTVTATVTQGGAPLVGATVNFMVTAGPNATQGGTDTIGSSGQAMFTYTSNGSPGTDTIQASGVSGEAFFSCTATKTWQVSEAAVFRVAPQGDVRSDETVHAASFQTGAADVAEWVEIAEPAEPGDVLELDPSRAGRYRLSTSACSMLVAGVVSTEPGVILGTDGAFETRALLALSGIVPVKVTDEGGPIETGDLLVTASTPGQAMRWMGTDLPPCALVGKALEPMIAREGIILVLLTAH